MTRLFCYCRNLCRPVCALAALMVLALAASHAAAQNTTISGTVYDPRTTTDSLPLPNVLVYATTNPVAALPSGVQCLTYQAPTGVVSYTYTDVQGNFTLDNIPENASYTIVIQAGKWRRQFPQAVASDPITGLALHMPSDHTQGDIPMIAIVTGSVDGVECVLRDMGIADTEFTDDSQTVNPGGHIHLYSGAGGSGVGGGAVINAATTPSETSLTENPATLNSYDMVMFPCQGSNSSSYTKSSTALGDIVDFANAGGRLFATHFSYVWLDPDSPYDSQFPSVANWALGKASLDGSQGYPATVQTNFSDGATLAQWLQNQSATNAGTANQIQIYDIRSDASSVVAPTQSWLTLNDGQYGGQVGNPVMQMTFNAPVGAPASSQCGRVMFNDYHVINLNVSSHNKPFPSECPSLPATMRPQEKMLEYALFDLSTFVQPVVVPTLSINFNPSPLIVKQNDTGDQLTVNVVNTSATTEISSSAVLTFSLPPLITATAITDATGGWACTATTLTCTRNSSIGGGVTDSVTLTLSVGAYPAGGLSSYTGQINAKVSSVTFSNDVTGQDQVIFQQAPTITWATPAPIIYGTALSAVQLDATAPVPGVFTYTPAAGTVLAVGQQTLNVSFAPTDTVHYISSTASVMLTVNPATPPINLSTSANDVFLTSAVTFTATVPVPGTPPGGTMTFYDGATQIGSAAVIAGSASITVSTLPAGTLTITAVYSGDSNYGPATSGPLTEKIQDFTLTAAGGGSASALPATAAVFELTVTPVGGTSLPGAIDLSVTGLPAGTSATFAPSGLPVNSPASNVLLTVHLAGSAAGALRRPSIFGEGALPAALALLVLPFGFARRRRRSLLVVALLTAAVLLGMNGCGGNLASQSFSFPVTAQSGGLSHTITVTLTVDSQSH